MSRKHRQQAAQAHPPSVIDGGLDHLGLLEHLESAGFQRVQVDGLTDDDIQVFEGDNELTPDEEQSLEADAHFVEDLTDAVVPAHLPDPVPRMVSERLGMRIRVLREICPKQPGSVAARNWALYTDGMQLAAYLGHSQVLGGRRRARKDVAWDLAHGHIALQSEEEWRSEQAERSGQNHGQSGVDHEIPDDDGSAECTLARGADSNQGDHGA